MQVNLKELANQIDEKGATLLAKVLGVDMVRR